MKADKNINNIPFVNGQILTSEQGEILLLDERTSCLIIFQSYLEMICVEIDVKKIKPLSNIIPFLLEQYGTRLLKQSIQLIGPPVNNKMIENELRGLGFNIITQVGLDSYSALLYTKDIKMKLKKAVGKPSVEITKEPAKSAVLVVESSKVIRGLLTKLFNNSKLKVVGETDDFSKVEAMVKKNRPDVITLDTNIMGREEMGILKKIALDYQISVVMVSSVSKKDSELVLEALENGALDYIHKPSVEEIDRVGPMIVNKVKVAAKSQVCLKNNERYGEKKPSVLDTSHWICIGASTGGTEAIKDVLVKLPNQIPPILIVQHIPEHFSKALAERLDRLCPFAVKEGEEGERIQSGVVYIAPGGKQMGIRKGKGEGEFYLDINDSPKMNRHKPSVDYLFESIRENFSGKMTGVILTGMGKDGAKGLLELKNKGFYTISQSEESCVVYGMPRAAYEIGAVCEVQHLDQIGNRLVELLGARDSKEAS